MFAASPSLLRQDHAHPQTRTWLLINAGVTRGLAVLMATLTAKSLMVVLIAVNTIDEGLREH